MEMGFQYEVILEITPYYILWTKPAQVKNRDKYKAEKYHRSER